MIGHYQRNDRDTRFFPVAARPPAPAEWRREKRKILGRGAVVVANQRSAGINPAGAWAPLRSPFRPSTGYANRHPG